MLSTHHKCLPPMMAGDHYTGDIASVCPGGWSPHNDVVSLMLSHCLRVRLSLLTNGILEELLSPNGRLAMISVMSPSDINVSTIHHLLTTAEISLCYLSSPDLHTLTHPHGNIITWTWPDLFQIDTHQLHSEILHLVLKIWVQLISSIGNTSLTTVRWHSTCDTLPLCCRTQVVLFS